MMPASETGALGVRHDDVGGGRASRSTPSSVTSFSPRRALRTIEQPARELVEVEGVEGCPVSQRT